MQTALSRHYSTSHGIVNTPPLHETYCALLLLWINQVFTLWISVKINGIANLTHKLIFRTWSSPVWLILATFCVVLRRVLNFFCGFCSIHSTTDQIFTFQQLFEKLGSIRKVPAVPCTCFLNLEKTYGLGPSRWLLGELREYGVDGHLLLVGKSLYSCSDVSVHFDSVIF